MRELGLRSIKHLAEGHLLKGLGSELMFVKLHGSYPLLSSSLPSVRDEKQRQCALHHKSFPK
jgi:hypothetical protein